MNRVKGSTWQAFGNLGYVNLLDYLAVGDGVTDCTSALTSALATGYPVFIPLGTYITGAQALASGAILFGTGRTSILKVKSATNAAFLTLTTLTNVILRDFAIDGNKALQSGSNVDAISISAGSGHVIDGVQISSTLGDGISIAGTATRIKIQDCTISGFVHNGITISDATRITISGVVCENSDAVATPGDGFAIVAAAAGSVIHSVNLVGCRSFTNVGRGYAFVGSGSKNVYDVVVGNCMADANTVHGFHALTAKQISISCCAAKNNAGDGYRLEGDTVDSRVTGCIADTNTLFGIREIVSGSTPNRNFLAGTCSVGNGTNTVTIVGANSLVPY